MADYIPFVNSTPDCSILKKYYQDAQAVRVSLDNIARVKSAIPPQVPLWLDPAVDAYHLIRTGTWPKDTAKWNDWQKGTWRNWERCFKSIVHYEVLLKEKPWVKKHHDETDSFVTALLNKCLEYRPKWISVPQLPLSKGVTQTNRRLAEATGQWKNEISDDTELILPLIIIDSHVLSTPSSRNAVAKTTVESFRNAQAEGVWVVDTCLSDQQRNKRFPERYENLIEFHSILREQLPKGAVIVAGPYWGANILLWAKGLCTSPAISLGTAYTYYISCGRPFPGSIRLAIPPIRRWVLQKQELTSWLNEAMDKLSPVDTAHKELLELRNNMAALHDRKSATDQVSRFYRTWLDRIHTVAHEGRALALYQDLSSAYVTGKQIPPLPKEVLSTNAPAIIRRPEAVAKQLMLYCL